MATLGLSGGAALEAKLREFSKLVGKSAAVDVGFMADATYPDGTPVAMVAAIQNFGAPAASIPARPFFSNMIREKSPGWGSSLGRVLVNTGFDSAKSMEAMGQGIQSQLQEAIIETDSPPLSPVTLMLRKMRSEDQTLVVTGATVGEAARRVANGESTGGVSTKPLDDTGFMKSRVEYLVKE